IRDFHSLVVLSVERTVIFVIQGAHSVLPQLPMTCKIEAECSYQTFVQFDSVVLLNHQLRQHAKRHVPL
ncbi:MAG: hypothetical protein ACK54P_02845, partial [Bacteroidota bacterium]